MIALLAATTMIGAAPVQAPSGGKIFSQMLARYHQANSILGTVEFVQSAVGPGLNTKTTTLTTVQMKKPNLFYIEQLRDRGEDTHFVAVCDGKQMAYTSPKKWLIMGERQKYVYEPAPAEINGGLDAFCTIILDRSLPVGLALYNRFEVNQFVKRVKRVRIVGETAVDGVPAWRLRADYIYTVANPRTRLPEIVVAAYITISKEYDLLGVSWEQIMVADKKQHKVTTVWKVRLQVDVPVDQKLFVVPRG
ncbi:MAG: DUF2092 domain-containing protein [Armatimonadetes bacterium]|nr:DUF2092 domain-containing protein [Armatimonadota bacterium]